MVLKGALVFTREAAKIIVIIIDTMEHYVNVLVKQPGRDFGSTGELNV